MHGLNRGYITGGGHVSIGYNYQNGKLMINPYEAEQIRKIFEWYLDGMSLTHITEKLHIGGYTTRYGSWNSWSSVKNILNNIIYTERMQYGGVLVENAHEAIIDEGQFKLVQSMRTQRREQYCKHGFQSKYLLTSILICGVCGGRYYRNQFKKYAYYACYSHSKKSVAMIKNPTCRNKIWRAPEPEALVDKEIRKLLASPQAFREITKASRPKPAAVDNANTESAYQRDRQADKQTNGIVSA